MTEPYFAPQNPSPRVPAAAAPALPTAVSSMTTTAPLPANNTVAGSPTFERAEPGSWANVWLIAKREISTRLGQTSFRVMTAVLLIAVVGGIILADRLVNNATVFDVGVTNTSAAAPIRQIAAAQGIEVNVLPAFIDQAAAEESVRQGLVRAAVIGDPLGAGALTVVTDVELPGALRSVFNTLAQQSAFAREITALGGDPAAVAAGMANAQLDVISLNPPPPVDPGQLIVAMATGILLYFAMMLGAQFVAQGVVEEKASRVVEVLLSNVRPWQLMAGKVLGIGLVTLGQLFAVVLIGAIVAQFTGLLHLTELRLGVTLLWAAIWALVGFVTFAVLMAALAARVSRQEEVASVTTPALMLMILPYFLGVTILPNDPTNQLATVLSYVPLFAPMLMPIRAALGVATQSSMLLSLLVSLAFLPILLWIAQKVYSGAILQTGGKVKLRDSLSRT